MDHYDHVVIGAGIEGSWTALQLVRLGRGRVLLVDQFPLPHSRGSSHGQTRIIRHAYVERVYTEMMPQSYQDWLQLEKDGGEKLFIPTDLLLVADETGYKDLDSTLGNLRDMFPGDDGSKFRQLSPSDLALEFPQAVFSEKHRACLDRTAGLLLADRCLAAVQRQFKLLGGEIRDSATVTSLVPGDHVTLHVTVGINDLQMTAAKVVVCAGPWTSKLLNLLLPQKLPLTALRVLVYYWRIKKDGPGAIPASFKDMSGDVEFWGIPECEYPGLVKVCHPSQLVVDPDLRDKNPETPDHTSLSNYIAQHFPGLDASSPAIVETCMYTMTPDEICIIDYIPKYKNIVYACGFSGSGFKKAPSVGRLICGLLYPKSESDITPFSLNRFSKN